PLTSQTHFAHKLGSDLSKEISNDLVYLFCLCVIKLPSFKNSNTTTPQTQNNSTITFVLLGTTK
ncbi:hypothetical protein PanWU01x14_269250, partial [Parasponia andersonii]